jgi:hypothetical protein
MSSLPADAQAGLEPVEASDLAAVERMIDEGGPVSWGKARAVVRCPTCGGHKSERASRCARCAGRSRGLGGVWLLAQQSAEQRAAERLAARRAGSFRHYCFSCGWSTPVESPPPRPGRCPRCGGTMLTELEPG